VSAVTSTGCRACRQLADTAGHEPYLLDDEQSRVRLWRCTGCATLWDVTERFIVPIVEEQADALHPTWRDHERWIRGTSLRSLLTHRSAVPAPLVRSALLHHDVLAPTGGVSADGVLVLHSGADTSALVDREPGDLRVRGLASVLRSADVRRLLLDPATPWTLDLEGEPLREMVSVSRTVRTWSSRVRGDELRFSFPARPAGGPAETGAPADLGPGGVPPLPPQGDPYAGHEVVDEELSAAVVTYLSYGSTPFPWADEQAVAALHGDQDVTELVDRVRSIDAEMTGYEVAWDRLGYHGGCAEAAATLRARHPELGPEALAALDWAFSYRWR
jgi:hypothetical protein